MLNDTVTPERVANALTVLRLYGVAERFPDVYKKAATDGTGILDFMADLLDPEILGRKQRRFERLLKQGGLSMDDCMERYDFEVAAAHGVDAAQARNLATGEFISAKRNVILAGAVGTGKSHLGRMLAVEAVRRDYRAVFDTTRELVERLYNVKDSFSFQKIYRFYLNADLLVLDDLAYLPFTPEKVEFLFRLVFDRHEKKTGSLIVTTNTDVKEWWSFFPSKAMGMAFSDRVLGGAVGIKFYGDSIR